MREFRKGVSKSKNIARTLPMDRKGVESEIVSLKSNNYLTSKGKLTEKAINILS
jgi:hypothetical protein